MSGSRRLIVISGGLASGKSSLAERLHKEIGCTVVKTSEIISMLSPIVNTDRQSLQCAGNELDEKTDHRWIADEVAKKILDHYGDLPMILEGVRKSKQVLEIQKAIGHRHVTHVHLSVDLESQKDRYERSKRRKDSGVDFDKAIHDTSERLVEELEQYADIVIDTKRHTVQDVFCKVSARLNLQSRSPDRLVDVLIGGQYGSEGKGNIADYLSPEYDILMRVGGPNAGHKVFEEPPYTHISLPCGTRRNDKTQLLIGPGAVIEPTLLLKEIRECHVEPSRLVIDEQAVLVQESDKKWEQDNLKKSIGSTANGVGKASARRITNRLRDNRRCLLAKDLDSIVPELMPYVGSTIERMETAYARGERVLLEGTQGTGLSLFHGEYPSVTSRDTSVAGCLSEAGIGPRRVNRIMLVCRTYPIRAGGNSGDFSKEIDWETISMRSDISFEQLKHQEVGSRSGKLRRVGEFDWHMLRRSCHLNSPSDVALTFVDYLDVKNSKAVRFDQLTSETIKFVEEIEVVAGVPCSLITNRFDHNCVIDRRKW